MAEARESIVARDSQVVGEWLVLHVAPTINCARLDVHEVEAEVVWDRPAGRDPHELEGSRRGFQSEGFRLVSRTQVPCARSRGFYGRRGSRQCRSGEARGRWVSSIGVIRAPQQDSRADDRDGGYYGNSDSDLDGVGICGHARYLHVERKPPDPQSYPRRMSRMAVPDVGVEGRDVGGSRHSVSRAGGTHQGN